MKWTHIWGLLRAKLTTILSPQPLGGTAGEAADLGSPDVAPQGWCCAQSRVWWARGNRVGALPPYVALFPMAAVMLTVLLSLLAQSPSKAKASLTRLTALPVAHGFTDVDSYSRAAGLRQLSSGGRQGSSQVSICSFVVFVCGGGENRVIH